MSIETVNGEEHTFSGSIITKIEESDLTGNFKTKLIERYPTLSNENLSLEEMAKLLDLPVHIVRRDRSVLIKRGILKKRGRKIDDKDIRKYHSEGLYDCQIAEKLGVVNGTVSRRLRKLDIDSNFGYTKERIIKKLKGMEKNLSHSPIAREVPYTLLVAAQTYFGSFNEAKKAAGLETFPVGGQKKCQQSILKFLYEKQSATYRGLAEFFDVQDVHDEIKTLETENKIQVNRTKRPFTITFAEEYKRFITPVYQGIDEKIIEQYFPNILEIIRVPTDATELYQSKVQQILKELKIDKKIDARELVSMLFRGEVSIARGVNDPRLKVLYRLERDRYVDISTPSQPERPTTEFTFTPTPERVNKKQEKRIKEKLSEIEKMEETFTEQRYYCGRERACPACIGYTSNEIMELRGYKCPIGENINQPLPEKIYDEIKFATKLTKSRLMSSIF